MGHTDRDTTDRYAYLDRVSVGQALNVLPRIRNKKSPGENPTRAES